MENAERYVITISRQFGSLGRTIAQRMSHILGIEFYDRDIVEATAKRMGLAVPEISAEEERAGGLFAGRMYPLGMGLTSMQQEIFQVQSNIIRDIAARESCIIVGRCADSILRDHARSLHVFIYAPVEARIRNCVTILGMDEKTARRTQKEVDRARNIYRLRYSEGVGDAFDLRNLMIDSSRFGADGTAKILSGIAKELFW